MKRRTFLEKTGLGVAGLAIVGPTQLRATEERTAPGKERQPGYRYRVAFGAWINDLRSTPLPLENWPAPQFDDVSVESAIRAMDVQGPAGFNLLDVWGLFATYGWPPDILSAVDVERRGRIERRPVCAASSDPLSGDGGEGVRFIRRLGVALESC